MVGKQHRLRRLDVGRARQDRFPVAIGQPDQRPFHLEDGFVEPVDRAPQPQAQVRRDLIVARAPGVEPPGERPDACLQCRLEVHVDVFQRRIPADRTGLDVGPQRVKARDERRHVLFGEQPGPAQAVHVGYRTRDIVQRQGTVELDRPREVGHSLVGGTAESPAPETH